jgi:hypothetical protein
LCVAATPHFLSNNADTKKIYIETIVTDAMKNFIETTVTETTEV